MKRMDVTDAINLEKAVIHKFHEVKPEDAKNLGITIEVRVGAFLRMICRTVVV
jgi:hypothetical protein